MGLTLTSPVIQFWEKALYFLFKSFLPDLGDDCKRITATKDLSIGLEQWFLTFGSLTPTKHFKTQSGYPDYSPIRPVLATFSFFAHFLNDYDVLIFRVLSLSAIFAKFSSFKTLLIFRSICFVLFCFS